MRFDLDGYKRHLFVLAFILYGLLIIAIAPIPGQEMRNAKFLFDNGVGFKIKKPKEAVSIVSDLISDESNFLKIKERIAKIAKPKAAEDIARLALSA